MTLTMSTTPKFHLKITTSPIQFYKTYLIRNYRISIGISAYEQAFLMGRPSNFVRGIEDPTIKMNYEIDETNYLCLIYNERFQTFLLPKTENFIITLSVNVYPQGQGIFNFEIEEYQPNGKDPGISDVLKGKDNKYWVIGEEIGVELPTSLILSTKENVHKFVTQLVKNRFFDRPQRALDIYNRCKEKFGANFHPRYMITSLNELTNKENPLASLDNSMRNDLNRIVFLNRHIKLTTD